MATNRTFDKQNYAWPSVDGFSDYEYTKKLYSLILPFE